ncbi:MAG TPA: hypothetical protein VKF40_30895 [Burkholderiales bacterium]|nr:hypothetical protein [Burkholderiales bacterium]
MDYRLTLYRDGLGPQAVARDALASSAVRVIYVVSGGLRLTADGATAALGANSAWHNTGALRLAAAHLATVALRWELAPAGRPDTALAGDGVTSEVLLAARIALEGSEPYLVRCDRVDFPPGGVALLHTHRGGGIRCVLFGAIEIESMGVRHRYGALKAWFEAGPDPVYAAASATEATAFARVMILPRSLLGRSSISYVNPEDLAKPKSQRYQVFIDAPVELP